MKFSFRIKTFYFNPIFFRDERDAKVAAQIAARIEKEDSEHRRAIEERDKNIARRLLVSTPSSKRVRSNIRY